MGHRREKDRQPFRTAAPEGDEQESSLEEEVTGATKESKAGKLVRKGNLRVRKGDDTPFRIAGPGEWNGRAENGPPRSDGPQHSSERGTGRRTTYDSPLAVEVCSLAKAKRWIEKGIVVTAGILNLARHSRGERAIALDPRQRGPNKRRSRSAGLQRNV